MLAWPRSYFELLLIAFPSWSEMFWFRTCSHGNSTFWSLQESSEKKKEDKTKSERVRSARWSKTVRERHPILRNSWHDSLRSQQRSKASAAREVCQQSQRSYLSLSHSAVKKLGKCKISLLAVVVHSDDAPNEMLIRRHWWCLSSAFKALNFDRLCVDTDHPSQRGILKTRLCFRHNWENGINDGWVDVKWKWVQGPPSGRRKEAEEWRRMEKMEGGRDWSGAGEWLMVNGSSRMRVIIMTDVVYSHFPLHHLFCGGGKPSHSFLAHRQVLQAMRGWKHLSWPPLPSLRSASLVLSFIALLSPPFFLLFWSFSSCSVATHTSLLAPHFFSLFFRWFSLLPCWHGCARLQRDRAEHV